MVVLLPSDHSASEAGTGTGTVSAYIGSYSTLHKIRKEWVRASVAWLEQTQSHQPFYSSLRHALQQWIAVPAPPNPVSLHRLRTQMANNPLLCALLEMHAAGVMDMNHGAVPTSELDPVVQQCSEAGLVGLWYLVHHSDCDGHHTPQQCAAILAAHQLIRPYFTEESFNGDNLLPVLQASVSHGRNLIYS